MTSEPELVAVGRVGPPRGVRGAVFVAPLTDDPQQRFAPGAQLSTDADPLTVASAQHGGAKLSVTFVGVEDRSAAEALRGLVLYVPASDRPALTDPDDFYDTDLIGLRAQAVDGSALGEIVGVNHGAGGDLLVLRFDEREHLVPFVAAFVPTVDVAGGRVVIDAPEGLFDL